MELSYLTKTIANEKRMLNVHPELSKTDAREVEAFSVGALTVAFGIDTTAAVVETFEAFSVKACKVPK